MSLIQTSKAALLAVAERNRQEELRITRNWGSLAAEDYHVLNTCTTEEVGEMCRATLEYNRANTPAEHTAKLEHLRDEAIQVAAMGLQIAEKAMDELEHWDDLRIAG